MDIDIYNISLWLAIGKLIYINNKVSQLHATEYVTLEQIKPQQARKQQAADNSYLVVD